MAEPCPTPSTSGSSEDVPNTHDSHGSMFQNALELMSAVAQQVQQLSVQLATMQDEVRKLCQQQEDTMKAVSVLASHIPAMHEDIRDCNKMLG